MGSVPRAVLPWRDRLCDTRAPSVAFGVLDWMVCIFLRGRWGCIGSLVGRFYFPGVFSRIHAGQGEPGEVLCCCWESL